MPPNTSRATGQGEFQFNTVTHQLTFAIVYDDLSGPATAGHIHGPGGPRTNAPAIVAFGVPDSPINGTATLTSAQAAALVAGELYVNIRTARYRDGEIRGQITK